MEIELNFTKLESREWPILKCECLDDEDKKEKFRKRALV